MNEFWYKSLIRRRFHRFEYSPLFNASPRTSTGLVETTWRRFDLRLAQTLIGNRVRLNVPPDLAFASYVQYDTITDSVGVNPRLRWTFRPEADLLVVYNHNIRSVLERWRLDSNTS